MPKFKVMKIISWNINGLRSGFDELTELAGRYHPDFICLQKVRCDEGREQFSIDGYLALYSSIDCSENSGVMTYAKLDPHMREEHLPERLDTLWLSTGGHMQAFVCNSFALINAYVPFSNLKLPGAIEYRQEWDVQFRHFVIELASRKPVIICGDLNIVHSPSDTCERRLVQRRGCFFDWERKGFNALLQQADLVDTFRYLHSHQQAVTFYGNYRSTGIGNRIDYFLMSRSLLPGLKESEILNGFGTRQSVPITLDFQP